MQSNIIYPNNISKYVGSITERDTVSPFLIRVRGNPSINKSFKTYEEAFEALKQFNIQHNLVKNIVYDRGDHYEMELTQDKTMLLDKDDLELFDKFCISVRGNNRYYARITIDNKSIDIHRYIYEQRIGNIPNGMVIDHISSIKSGGLDNRKINLRLATISLNCRNKKMVKNTSGIINVYYSKQNKKWYGEFSYNKIVYRSQLFTEKQQAQDWLLEVQPQVIQDELPTPNRIIC